MIDTNTTPSNPIPPVIKTDLVLPLKALTIYQDHLITILDHAIEAAKSDVKDCAKHKTDPNWDWERGNAETRLYVYRRMKTFLYIPHYECSKLLGKQFHFTRNFKEEQKKSFAWRNKVLLNDNLKCRRCGCEYSLEAHHIYAFKFEPELRYDANNGITFCQDCHKLYHKIYGNTGNFEDVIAFLKSHTTGGPHTTESAHIPTTNRTPIGCKESQ